MATVLAVPSVKDSCLKAQLSGKDINKNGTTEMCVL